MPVVIGSLARPVRNLDGVISKDEEFILDVEEGRRVSNRNYAQTFPTFEEGLAALIGSTLDETKWAVEEK